LKITDAEAIEALDLYLKYGDVTKVAREMGLYGYHAAKRRICRGATLRGIPNPIGSVDKSVATDEFLDDTLDGMMNINMKTDRVLTLRELLESAEVSPREWQVSSWSANKWESFSSKDGIVELWQIKASLEKVPSWVLDPVRPVKPIKRKPPESVPGPISTCLVVPDSQNGYKYDHKTQTYTPLHDRKAWDLAIQMAELMQPEVIVLLGDMLDLAPFSRFSTEPALRHTTQPSIIELHWWLSQLRLASPSSEIIFIEGNHEARLQRTLVDQVAGEFTTLVPADDPDGPELFSVPRLLGLDSLDIEYVGPYGEEWWLWDKVRVHHGRLVRKGGATVAAVLKDARYHEVFGHIHRVELGSKRLHGPHGSNVIYAMSPGTLCRVDGVVPAVKKNIDWQQGLGVISYDRQSDHVHMNVIHIEDGVCIFNGTRFEGSERVEDIREQTGWPF